MAEILFNQNIDLYGFNMGKDDTNTSYPPSDSAIEKYTQDSIVFSFVNDDMYQGDNLYGVYKSDALARDRYVIYKQLMGSNVKTYIATIEGVTDGLWDYNVGRGEKYKYIVETMPSEQTENKYSISLETPYFVSSDWSCWSICDIEKSLEDTEESDVDIYIPSDTVFLMKGNVTPGSINDNLKIIKYDTLGQYGRTIQNQQKYDSGNMSCLIGNFEAVEIIDGLRNVIIIDDVYNQDDLNNVFINKIIDLQITDYDNQYFLFPNYSDKYYECVKGVAYDVLQSDDDIIQNWNVNYDLYYTKNSNGQYIGVDRVYVPLEEKPTDFDVNYSQYYIKNNDTYIPLSEPPKQLQEWPANTYYILQIPDYEDSKYYKQIIDYKLIETPSKTKYKILNTLDILSSWRECVSNGKLKLLKAPNGMMWVVSINDQNSLDINWQSSDYPATINFNWQEVIDKKKISIIKW